MIILNNFFDDRIEYPTAVTIGKFDGFHRGHELLLEQIENKTDCNPTVKSLVITFSVSPRIKLGDNQNKNLITDEERRIYLEDRGIDYLLECTFDDRFMKTSPDDFIRILISNFNLKYLAVGSDFTFGYKGIGNADYLVEKSKLYNYKVDVIEKLKSDGVDISSTYIRQEITKGNVEKADELLGYPYFIFGEVVHGNRIGTKIGIPTINQIPPNDKLLPSNGVYITEVILHHDLYHGVTNIGIRPTIGDKKGLTVETNLLDVKDIDVYDKFAKVIFVKKIRQEIKFNNLDELSIQIKKDRETAISFFGLT